MDIRRICLVVLTAFMLGACGPRSDSPVQAPLTDALPPAEAEAVASRDFGDYVLHFNAISTDQLMPEIAKTYDIVRSRNRALLNVSIVKKVPGALGQPVAGSVTALVANDTGQIKDASIREIREGDAVYYIADFPVSDAETVVFTVDATPVNETNRLSVRFTRTFYE